MHAKSWVEREITNSAIRLNGNTDGYQGEAGWQQC